MSAISSYKQYGVTRTQVHSMLINLPHYPVIYKDTLESYFGLVTTGKHIISNLSNGVVRSAGVAFLCVFHRCTAQEAKKAAHIHISYRIPKHEYELEAYAVIRILNGEERGHRT